MSMSETRIIVITSAAVVREADNLAQGAAMARRSQGRVYVEVDQAAWPVVQEAPNGWPVGQRPLSDTAPLVIEVKRVCLVRGERSVFERRGDRFRCPACRAWDSV